MDYVEGGRRSELGLDTICGSGRVAEIKINMQEDPLRAGGLQLLAVRRFFFMTLALVPPVSATLFTR